MRIAVIGGGVAGLSTAYHLIELLGPQPDSSRYSIDLYAMLAPPPAGLSGGGNGLGGKAMSRSFEGRYDMVRGGVDRIPFYGPMMPHKGTVPHGYHVFWDYPNLRRMLGDPHRTVWGVRGPPPTETLPGGASVISSFQGNIDDPSPGGPGIASIGLIDPDFPATARHPASQALFRLQSRRCSGILIDLLTDLFGNTFGLNPLVFADLLFCPELDIELRLALIGSSIMARNINPEKETVTLNGKKLGLNEVEYDVWTQEMLTGWAKDRKKALESLRTDTLLSSMVLGEVMADGTLQGINWLFWLPDAIEGDLRIVLFELNRVLRQVPAALANLATGTYPVWRTLHMRFGPDATFASPFSFDAAQAVRSIGFCFLTPQAGRAWSIDGSQIHKLWGRMWDRLKEAAQNANIPLNIVEGQVHALVEDTTGENAPVTLQYAAHQTHGGYDSPLGMPHIPDRRGQFAAPEGASIATFDACIVAIAPPLAQGILGPPSEAQLAPLREKANETMELLIWLDTPIDWSPAARLGLSQSCITGLEGPFCLLADYRCGLWAPETLAAEDPFGTGNFSGSILESCGGFEDLYACPTRTDAFGWPADIKKRIADLLSQREFFEDLDSRPWNFRDGTVPKRLHGTGTYKPERANSESAWGDWIEASRWLVYGYLRQLSMIQSLGPRACRQLAQYAALLNPTSLTRDAILAPPPELSNRVRYVVMRSTKARNRIFCPGLGDWARRPISGLPFDGFVHTYPAGDWTRNGLDIVCMEGACLSGMRAARGMLSAKNVPISDRAPLPERVLPAAAWYAGTDPTRR